MPNTEAFVAQLFTTLACLLFGIALLCLWYLTLELVASIHVLGDAVASFVCHPILQLGAACKKVLSARFTPKKAHASGLLEKIPPVLGSPRVLCSLLFSLVLVTVSFLRAGQDGTLSPYLTKLFFSTPLGSIFDLILNGTSLSIAKLASASCSTLIAWFLFTGGAGENCSGDTIFEKVIIFIYHIIYLAAGCIIAVWLSGCWQILADWLFTLYASAKDAFAAAKESGVGIAKLILTAIPLALLLYLWIAALSVTVREYISSIGHAVLAGLLMAGLWLILNGILPPSIKHGPAGDWIGYALIALTMFVSECTRADPEFLDLGNK